MSRLGPLLLIVSLLGTNGLRSFEAAEAIAEILEELSGRGAVDPIATDETPEAITTGSSSTASVENPADHHILPDLMRREHPQPFLSPGQSDLSNRAVLAYLALNAECRLCCLRC